MPKNQDELDKWRRVNQLLTADLIIPIQQALQAFLVWCPDQFHATAHPICADLYEWMMAGHSTFVVERGIGKHRLHPAPEIRAWENSGIRLLDKLNLLVPSILSAMGKPFEVSTLLAANNNQYRNKGGRPRISQKTPAVAAFNYRTATAFAREKADRGTTIKEFGGRTRDIGQKFLGEKGLRRILRWVSRNPKGSVTKPRDKTPA
jgi:hypothetical protein